MTSISDVVKKCKINHTKSNKTFIMLAQQLVELSKSIKANHRYQQVKDEQRGQKKD